MIFAIALAGALLAADPEEKGDFDSYETQARVATDDRTAEITAEIAGRQRLLKGRRANQRERKEMLAEIKALKAEQQEISDGKLVAPTLSPPFRPGKIGKPFTDHAAVLQIIGPEEMLAEMGNRPLFAAAPAGANPRAVMAGSAEMDLLQNQARLNPVDNHVTVLIRGLKTSFLSDGAPADLPALMRVAGNYTYETAAGATRTVMVLERFNPDLAEAKAGK